MEILAKFIQGRTPLCMTTITYYKVCDEVLSNEGIKNCLQNKKIDPKTIDKNSYVSYHQSMGGASVYIDKAVPLKIKIYERVI